MRQGLQFTRREARPEQTLKRLYRAINRKPAETEAASGDYDTGYDALSFGAGGAATDSDGTGDADSFG